MLVGSPLMIFHSLGSCSCFRCLPLILVPPRMFQSGATCLHPRMILSRALVRSPPDVPVLGARLLAVLVFPGCSGLGLRLLGSSAPRRFKSRPCGFFLAPLQMVQSGAQGSLPRTI